MDPHRHRHRLAFRKERNKVNPFALFLSFRCQEILAHPGRLVKSCEEKNGDPCGTRTHVWGVRGPRLNLLTNGPSSSRTSLIPFPPVAFRLPSKTAYRSVAPPLQNGPVSLGSVLALRGVSLTLKGGAYRALQAGTPSGTRTLDTLIKSQVLYQLS